VLCEPSGGSCRPSHSLPSHVLRGHTVLMYALTFLRSALCESPMGSSYFLPGSWPYGAIALAPLNPFSLSPAYAFIDDIYPLVSFHHHGKMVSYTTIFTMYVCTHRRPRLTLRFCSGCAPIFGYHTMLFIIVYRTVPLRFGLLCGVPSYVDGGHKKISFHFTCLC